MTVCTTRECKGTVVCMVWHVVMTVCTTRECEGTVVCTVWHVVMTVQYSEVVNLLGQ